MFISYFLHSVAIVWWRAARENGMPPYKCTFTEHLGYLVFSSTISFYLPLLVMVFTYCRIYRAAVKQTKSLKLGTKQVLMASGELQLRIHRGGTTREGHHQHHHSHSATATSTPEEPEEEPLSALQNNGLHGMESQTLFLCFECSECVRIIFACIYTRLTLEKKNVENFIIKMKILPSYY